MNLYGFVGNAPVLHADYLGQNILKKLWKVVKNIGFRLGDMIWKASEKRASTQAALGDAYEGSAVVGAMGFKAGRNLMFFPASCELALYKYATGALDADPGSSVTGNRTLVEEWIHQYPVGWNIGISGTLIYALPLGREGNNADSWLGWFYTLSLAAQAGPPPINAGLTGSIFGSDNWVGEGVGVGAGPSISPVSISGDIAALYFTQSGSGNTWVENDNIYRLKKYKCLCMALRSIARTKMDEMHGLLLSIFD